MPRQRYTDTDKQRAIALADDVGVAQAARELQVDETTLRGWRKKSERERVLAKLAAVQQMVDHLGREVHDLRLRQCLEQDPNALD